MGKIFAREFRKALKFVICEDFQDFQKMAKTAKVLIIKKKPKITIFANDLGCFASHRLCESNASHASSWSSSPMLALPYILADKGGGHIAAITSVAATKGLGASPACSATKALQTAYRHHSVAAIDRRWHLLTALWRRMRIGL